jgi:hypothetical protein
MSGGNISISAACKLSPWNFEREVVLRMVVLCFPLICVDRQLADGTTTGTYVAAQLSTLMLLLETYNQGSRHEHAHAYYP